MTPRPNRRAMRNLAVMLSGWNGTLMQSRPSRKFGSGMSIMQVHRYCPPAHKFAGLQIRAVNNKAQSGLRRH